MCVAFAVKMAVLICDSSIQSDSATLKTIKYNRRINCIISLKTERLSTTQLMMSHPAAADNTGEFLIKAWMETGRETGRVDVPLANEEDVNTF